MGWKSAINPPDSIRDVVCKCEVGCAEYRILIGFWYEDDDRWMVAGFPGAVVVQWHEIPKGGQVWIQDHRHTCRRRAPPRDPRLRQGGDEVKTIPFVANNDMWHDASVEVPDSSRTVLVANNRTIETDCRAGFSWLNGRTPEYWRELPAPPKPTPKIVPHSLEHWHDPKVERPEPGKAFVVMFDSGMASWHHAKTGPDWDVVARWTYYPETAR